jgi:fibronectin type 3 domain-containing protein
VRAAGVLFLWLGAGLCACAGLPRPPGLAAPDPAAYAPAPLAAPSALRAESGELRQVPLVWQPVRNPEITGYTVERAAREGPFERVAVVRGRFRTQWVDREGLADETAYRYRVRSLGEPQRVSEASSPIATAATAGAPPPPRGLEVISQLPRRVAVQWRPSPDPRVTGYVVERSPSAEGPFLERARLSGRLRTAWVDEGLDDLRVFYYRVSARNEAGVVGRPGRAAQAVTKAEPLPPIGLRVEEKRLGSNLLVWERNVEEDVAGYRLLRRRGEHGEPELVATLGPATTRARDSEVGAGESVSYRVVAFDDDGLASRPSDPVQVQSEAYALAAHGAREGIALSWNPRHEEGYERARVYRLGWLRRHELARVEGDAFVDPDVEPGHTYRYAVVLERADGTRAPTSAAVEAHAPASRAASAPGDASAPSSP